MNNNDIIVYLLNLEERLHNEAKEANEKYGYSSKIAWVKRIQWGMIGNILVDLNSFM